MVERVGDADTNQAVAALSVVRRSGGAQLDTFVAVTNLAAADVTRRLEIYADGVLVDARDLAIGAAQRTEAIIGTVPSAAKVVEARLAGSDALAVDDRALAIVPSGTPIRTLLVSDGNAYLENALALLPRLELYAVNRAGYDGRSRRGRTAGTPYGLIVFDGFVPPAPPRIPSPLRRTGGRRPVRSAGQVIGAPSIGRTTGRPAPPLHRPVERPCRPHADGHARHRHAPVGRDLGRRTARCGRDA